MSLYPAPPTGYYDRIYSRYTGDVYGSTLLGGNGDEKTVGDWSMGMPGSGLGFSTSGPYGMMMTSSYEQFARNVFPPEMEMANTHTVDFVSVGDRFPVSSSARLKREPEIAGDADQLRQDSNDDSTGSEMATITAAAADTSAMGDDVIKEKLNDGSGNDVETAGHVFAPDSDHHGHERHCLLWACKTCKKRSAAAVDRRKVSRRCTYCVMQWRRRDFTAPFFLFLVVLVPLSNRTLWSFLLSGNKRDRLETLTLSVPHFF